MTSKVQNQVVTTAAVSTYPWIPVDPFIEEQNYQLALWKSGTTFGSPLSNTEVTFVIEYTLSNVFAETSALAIPLRTVIASANGLVTALNVTHPVQAFRLRATVVSGESGLVFQILQAGV